MKIVIYCQHVLGVGHFFRTLEIARAMKEFNVILITGGGNLDVVIPDFITHVKLPGLMMDEDFSKIHSIDPQQSVETVKAKRQKLMLELFKKEKPDIFLVELYPFGRRAFRFELNPSLDFIKLERKIKCKIICSLRDILVEKENRLKYETRVIEALNKWFDAVLIHSDPGLVRLSSTFSRTDQIRIPIEYTGFVTPLPDKNKANQIRNELGISKSMRLIVASVGGGSVGAKLLDSIINVCSKVLNEGNIKLLVLTGPYMDKKNCDNFYTFVNDNISVKPFVEDFVSYLASADLSISMGGYNTCMNIVAADIPALIWPFHQNHEQKMRVEKLIPYADVGLLEDKDLELENFSKLIQLKLSSKKRLAKKVLNIDGAERCLEWVRDN